MTRMDRLVKACNDADRVILLSSRSDRAFTFLDVWTPDDLAEYYGWEEEDVPAWAGRVVAFKAEGPERGLYLILEAHLESVEPESGRNFGVWWLKAFHEDDWENPVLVQLRFYQAYPVNLLEG